MGKERHTNSHKSARLAQLRCLEFAFGNDVASELPGCSLNDGIFVIIERSLNCGEGSNCEVERRRSLDPLAVKAVTDECSDALARAVACAASVWSIFPVCQAHLGSVTIASLPQNAVAAAL